MIQDRLKFKHWDKQINKMRYGDIQLSNDGKPFIIVDNIENPIEDIEDVITLQCTGLKDKNGELVYFDDLVKLDDGIVCIVKQIEDINDIEYGRVVAIPVFCFGKKYQTQYIPTVIAEGEKVGNFYENPELLESEVE